jgi:hypothetical protein
MVRAIWCGWTYDQTASEANLCRQKCGTRCPLRSCYLSSHAVSAAALQLESLTSFVYLIIAQDKMGYGIEANAGIQNTVSAVKGLETSSLIAPTLPDDILLQIASHLRPREVNDLLLEVNRLFFRHAISSRYSFITLADFDSRTFWLMSRMRYALFQ